MAAYDDYAQFEIIKAQFYQLLLELRGEVAPAQVLQVVEFLLSGQEPEGQEPAAKAQAPAHWEALERHFEQIIQSDWASAEFANFLNRCCYTLINHWSTDSSTKPLIRDLVSLLKPPAEGEAEGEAEGAKDAMETRRSQLLLQFRDSRHYQALIERAKAETASLGPSPDDPSSDLGKLVHRYPCLYNHYFLRWDKSEAGRRAVRSLQSRREQEFSANLRRYALNLGRLGRSSGRDRGASAALHRSHRPFPIDNPTLLSREQLQTALHEFSGATGRSHSYRRTAHSTLRTMYRAPTHREVKRQVNQYLTEALQSYSQADYGKRRFDRWLDEKLEFTLPEQDGERPTEKLLVHTCTNLVDSFLAHPRDLERRNDHLMFVDLVGNVGPTFTVGLLLKLVLLCRQVEANVRNLRDRISQRLAELFEHYEQTDSHEVAWLLRCLDNLMIASTIHFGPEDPSLWRKLIQL